MIDLLCEIGRCGRIAPKTCRIGEALLLDERSIMLHDLFGGFDAPGIDRGLWLGKVRSIL